MTRVIEVLYNVNNTMKYGFFKEKQWEEIINAFFVEGNAKIPKSLQDKDLNKLSEKDYVKFFEALDYTVVGVSNYDPNVHQPAIIKSNKEKELPEC